MRGETSEQVGGSSDDESFRFVLELFIIEVAYEPNNVGIYTLLPSSM